MRTIRPKTGLLMPGGIARAFAVVAMVMQVLVATVHLGGEVIAASSTPDFDPRFGFLQICTGHGIEILGPTGSSQSTSGTAACPVCTSVCAFGFDQPAATTEVLLISFAEVDIDPAPAVTLAADTRFLTDGPIRAPPALLA